MILNLLKEIFKSHESDLFHVCLKIYAKNILQNFVMHSNNHKGLQMQLICLFMYCSSL